ncbi:LytR/AlgR family response regulator transcription factor [Coprobacter sp.]
MILNCYIVDDEPLAIRLLESYVEKTPFLHLQGSCTNAVTALADLTEKPVDLLFLDIQMPDLNGMEFSKIIRDKCRIIFTTAFEQYAVDSYRVNALDYLLKPISYSDFLNACEKARQWYELSDNAVHKKDDMKSIFIKTDYKLVQIELDKILYVEGLKDYVKIYVENETQPILSLMSLKSLEEVLPSDRFIRVHRSFIIQADKIKVVERNRIVFGKQYIPISDSYKNNFQTMINQRSISGKS